MRAALRNFDFGSIFNHLGWDHATGGALQVGVDSSTFTLTPVVHKRGMMVYLLPSESSGGIPSYSLRRKIEVQVRKRAHEHIIIYADRVQGRQVWQWVRREPGSPTACREHSYSTSQPGDGLIEKLEKLAFSLDEEDLLTITDVARRTRSAFDVERVTRRFYESFKRQHHAFLASIQGIQGQGDREWYASLLLNRLMFVYFIQKKGFLDGDTDYLRHRLEMMQEKEGKDHFLSFYRHFALRLFHEGLGAETRDSELDELLGAVPYVNGGLFDVHKLEVVYQDIDIPDEAFERIFDFFDSYQWHLDERPLRLDNEINPDVLGYIFEKYVNQKQMGAYYTKEDITGYIAQSTVLPHVLCTARADCEIAFEQGSAVWRLLVADPGRYIFGPVSHGGDTPLPEDIQAGMSMPDKRERWNQLAPPEFGLATETWRDVVARRQRVAGLRTKLLAGEICTVDDLLSHNLDIRQFCQDVIENAEGPELVRAVYRAISCISVLDPACGSGAFLFAALNVLEPVYEACLERMQSFLDDAAAGPEKHRGHFVDFQVLLDQVAAQPNRRYFILKSIILNNLYGVDIMEEAVEICKLRLFLKLVAQVDAGDQIEPLPDIDFNIRAGNSLIGFSRYGEVESAIGGDTQIQMDLGNDLEAINGRAVEAEKAFKEFRGLQSAPDMTSKALSIAKDLVQEKLNALRAELDRYLSTEYVTGSAGSEKYRVWHENFRPFHWWVEFYGIISGGGFDVIIGNPPYLELREVTYKPRHYVTLDSGAVHAMFVERSLALLNARGSLSMILPMSLVSTQRMASVQRLLESERSVWYANFSWRPGRLFDAVNRALTIFVAVPPQERERTFSTSYQKWSSHSRDLVFPLMSYAEVSRGRPQHWVPKINGATEQGILSHCLAIKGTLGQFVRSGSAKRVFYRTTGGLYWKVFTDFPPAFTVNGRPGHSTRETSFGLDEQVDAATVIALLSSDLFWWWYTISSNCRDLNPFDIQSFPVPETIPKDLSLRKLGHVYVTDLQEHSTMLTRNQRQTGRTETQAFRIQISKPIIDQIDRAMASHYGLNDEEVDFLINYDIKFRLGPGAGDDD